MLDIVIKQIGYGIVIEREVSGGGFVRVEDVNMVFERGGIKIS